MYLCAQAGPYGSFFLKHSVGPRKNLPGSLSRSCQSWDELTSYGDDYNGWTRSPLHITRRSEFPYCKHLSYKGPRQKVLC